MTRSDGEGCVKQPQASSGAEDRTSAGMLNHHEQLHMGLMLEVGAVRTPMGPRGKVAISAIRTAFPPLLEMLNRCGDQLRAPSCVPQRDQLFDFGADVSGWGVERAGAVELGRCSVEICAERGTPRLARSGSHGRGCRPGRRVQSAP